MDVEVLAALTQLRKSSPICRTTTGSITAPCWSVIRCDTADLEQSLEVDMPCFLLVFSTHVYFINPHLKTPHRVRSFTLVVRTSLRKGKPRKSLLEDQDSKQVYQGKHIQLKHA